MGTLKQAVDRVAAAKTAIGNAITAKGGTVAADDGLEDFSTDIATITNQYTASDEGKVVSGGALVAQTAYPSTITANGTYNTAENNSVTVSVPSLPAGIEMTKLTPATDNITNDDMYIINAANRTYIVGHFEKTNSDIPKFSYPSTFIPNYTKMSTINNNYYLINGVNSTTIYNDIANPIEIDNLNKLVSIKGTYYGGSGNNYNYAIMFTNN